MSILDRVKKFIQPEPEIKIVKETIKEKADINLAIKPIFSDVPPDDKSGKYLDELQSWTFIAISAIADEIATTPIVLLDRSGNPVESHKVLDLINNPNPIQTRVDHFWLTSVILCAEGEVPWLFDKPVNPQAMISLNPENLTVISDDTDLISGYRYRRTNGTDQIIDKDELILLKIPNWDTPFRGSSTMKKIAKTIDLDNFVEQYTRNFFYNSALPTGVVETDTVLQADQITRLREQLNKLYRGKKNAHRLGVFDAGLKFKNTAFNMNELAMDKVTDRIRDKILATYKVPKSILGIIDDVNRASAVAADNVFAKRAVKPKLRLIEAQLNEFLLPMFSRTEGYKLVFDDPSIDDEKQRAEINQIYINSGVLKINEVREELGKAPIDEPKPEPKEPEPKKERKLEKGTLKSVLVDYLKTGRPKKYFTTKEKEKYHEEKLLFTDPMERAMSERLERYFGSLETRTLRDITTKEIIKEDDTEILYDEEKEAEIVAKISAPFLTDTVIKQSALTYALLGIDNSFKGTDILVKEFVATRSILFGSAVSNTTKDDLNRVMKDWGKSGEPVRGLRDRLTQYFGKAEKNRVENITRTEVSRAAGFATSEVYREVGAVGKEWITAGDERVCQYCAPMNGRVIPINRNFWNKGDSMYGQDLGKLNFKLEGVKQFPLHPQCRCDLVPHFDKKDIPSKPFAYKDQSDKRRERREREEEKEKRYQNLDKKEKAVSLKEDKLSKKEKELDKDIKKLESINGQRKET